MPKEAAATPERGVSVRDAIHAALVGRPLSAREISQRASVSEKDVAEHLEHLQRSLRKRGERLVVKPAECLSCGYVFRERAKLTSPGRCPKCQAEHIAASRFKIEPVPGGDRQSASPRPRRQSDDEDDDG